MHNSVIMGHIKDFQSQLKQFQKMGSMTDIIGMMPGGNKLKGLNVDEKKLVWIDGPTSDDEYRKRISEMLVQSSSDDEFKGGFDE